MSRDTIVSKLFISIQPSPERCMPDFNTRCEDQRMIEVEPECGARECSICCIQPLTGEDLQRQHRPDSQRLSNDQSLRLIREAIRSLLKAEAILSGQLESLEYRADGLVVSETRNSVCYEGRQLSFTRMEYAILKELVKTPGVTLSREYLYKAVTGRNLVSQVRSLDVHISKIRRKLKTAGMGDDTILSYRGEGYRFR